MPVLDLPTDRPRPPCARFSLPPRSITCSTRRLLRRRAQARARKRAPACSPRCSARSRRRCIGRPAAGRPRGRHPRRRPGCRRRTTSLVGHCVNLLPLRVAVDADERCRQPDRRRAARRCSTPSSTRAAPSAALLQKLQLHARPEPAAAGERAVQPRPGAHARATAASRASRSACAQSAPLRELRAVRQRRPGRRRPAARVPVQHRPVRRGHRAPLAALYEARCARAVANPAATMADLSRPHGRRPGHRGRVAMPRWRITSASLRVECTGGAARRRRAGRGRGHRRCVRN